MKDINQKLADLRAAFDAFGLECTELSGIDAELGVRGFRIPMCKGEFLATMRNSPEHGPSLQIVMRTEDPDYAVQFSKMLDT